MHVSVHSLCSSWLASSHTSMYIPHAKGNLKMVWEQDHPPRVVLQPWQTLHRKVHQPSFLHSCNIKLGDLKQGYIDSLYLWNFEILIVQQAKWIPMLSLVLQGVGVGTKIVCFWKRSRLLLLSMGKWPMHVEHLQYLRYVGGYVCMYVVWPFTCRKCSDRCCIPTLFKYLSLLS